MVNQICAILLVVPLSMAAASAEQSLDSQRKNGCQYTTLQAFTRLPLQIWAPSPLVPQLFQ